MTDNLKLNLELTVDGESRQVDIDKVAVTAERTGAAERLAADQLAAIQTEQLEGQRQKLEFSFKQFLQSLVVEAQTETQAELAKLVATGELQATELVKQTALLKRLAACSRPPSAGRFHSAGPEALALLESSATALAQGAGGAPQQVQVVVENRGATQQEVVEQRAAMDGGRLVVNVALDDIARRGPLSQALEQTYALGRRTG